MESVALDRSDTVGFGVIAITYLILVNNGIKSRRRGRFRVIKKWFVEFVSPIKALIV